MTKQEEVSAILTKYTGRYGLHLDSVLEELTHAGVVQKKDELPIITKKGWYYLVEPLKSA